MSACKKSTCNHLQLFRVACEWPVFAGLHTTCNHLQLGTHFALNIINEDSVLKIMYIKRIQSNTEKMFSYY